MPPATIFLDNTVAEFRLSPAAVVHQDSHHTVVLTKLFPDTLLDRSPGDRHRAERVLELGGVVVSVLDRLDHVDVRLLPLRRVIASAVGLRWVRRQHSSLWLLCIT